MTRPMVSLILPLSLLLFLAAPAKAWLSVIRQGPESAEVPNPDDRFGRVLCAGDFDGDGHDDLAAARPTSPTA